MSSACAPPAWPPTDSSTPNPMEKPLTPRLTWIVQPRTVSVPAVRVAHIHSATGIYGAERWTLTVLRHHDKARVDAEPGEHRIEAWGQGARSVRRELRIERAAFRQSRQAEPQTDAHVAAVPGSQRCRNCPHARVQVGRRRLTWRHWAFRFGWCRLRMAGAPARACRYASMKRLAGWP